MQQSVQTDATCNIQQCWKLLANNVSSVCTGLNTTMLERLCKLIQHCCATHRRSRTKRNVGSFWLKILTGFKQNEQLPTTRNNMQQHVIECANDPTCIIQQCCVRCTRLYSQRVIPIYELSGMSRSTGYFLTSLTL